MEKMIVKAFRGLLICTCAYEIHSNLCKKIPHEFKMWGLALKRNGADDVFANYQICFCITRLSIPNSKYEYIQVATYYKNNKHAKEARKCMELSGNFLIAEGMEEIEL